MWDRRETFGSFWDCVTVAECHLTKHIQMKAYIQDSLWEIRSGTYLNLERLGKPQFKHILRNPQRWFKVSFFLSDRRFKLLWKIGTQFNFHIICSSDSGWIGKSNSPAVLWANRSFAFRALTRSFFNLSSSYKNNDLVMVLRPFVTLRSDTMALAFSLTFRPWSLFSSTNWKSFRVWIAKIFSLHCWATCKKAGKINLNLIGSYVNLSQSQTLPSHCQSW